ncbi:LysR family transcriptional regulator [Streptomyces sp. NPDC012616]|uniref:LysR family transcriptional regulator n=1 Tax=Streptomyces sp. NPDC012616 TaxID=3364840 RepID=UPI0036EEEA1D
MLKTVAARGSIAAAAQSLALSAGAVPQHPAALRREVGVDLLRPDGRTVALTEAGRMLLQHADRILDAVQEAESAVAAVKGMVGTTATLAALPPVTMHLVSVRNGPSTRRPAFGISDPDCDSAKETPRMTALRTLLDGRQPR